MKQGHWIVIGLLAAGLLGYLGILFMADRSTPEPGTDRNYAYSEAKHKLGPDARVLAPLRTIDAQKKESVAYVPMAQMPVTDKPQRLTYVQRLSVLHHTRRKTFEVLTLDEKGLYNERREELLPMATNAARAGFAIEVDSTDAKNPLLIITQVDAQGQPQSESVPVRFNPQSGFYEVLPMP
jgi:hypothetical protein